MWYGYSLCYVVWLLFCLDLGWFVLIWFWLGICFFGCDFEFVVFRHLVVACIVNLVLVVGLLFRLFCCRECLFAACALKWFLLVFVLSDMVDCLCGLDCCLRFCFLCLFSDFCLGDLICNSVVRFFIFCC